MSTIDVDRFRTALLDERERVTAAIENIHKENPGSIEDETGDEAHDQHIADTATVTFDRGMDSTLEDNSEHVLSSIDAALQRIDEGTYGVCTNCGKPIAKERLEALPWVNLCIDCARKAR